MRFPIERYLTPPPGPTDTEGFAVVEIPIVTGLPQRFDLGGVFEAIATLPTGVALGWMEADPHAIVSRGADERAPYLPPAVDDARIDLAPPFRLVVRSATERLHSAAVVSGLMSAPLDGSDTGVRVQVVFLDWLLHAGSVRGAGDFGSFIKLGWRVANRAIDEFGPAPTNRHLVKRLPPAQRIESELGLRYYKIVYRAKILRSLVR